MNDHYLNFDSWKETVSSEIQCEKFWGLIAYQKGLYLYDLVWTDSRSWFRDPRGIEIARQIIRSTGSITANIEEGFGRGFGKQLIYFYTVALGSARETKGWFYRAKNLLSADLLQSRLDLTGEIIALLITEINRQKNFR